MTPRSRSTRGGRILGVHDVFLHDTGAYDPYGLTVPINSQCTLLGQYGVPAYDSEFKAVFTNKTIVTPYRGAGRQHGVFVMERLLDLAARELGIDRVEIRRRNLLPPDAFPHDHQILYQDMKPLVYDSGNYAPALERAAEAIGWKQFLSDEQPRLRGEGRRVGIGLVTYVEGTGIGPYEGARVTIESDGKVSVATGVGTQGQGHFTVFAQVVADQLGVTPERRAGHHRRHRRVLVGHRHLRQPRRGGGGQRFSRRRDARARQGARARRRRAGGGAGGPRARGRPGGGAGGSGPERDVGGAGGSRQPATRRRGAGHRARARGHHLLRPRPGCHRERRARHDRRGRSGDDGDRGEALRRGPRLRSRAQPAHPRGADPGRRGAGTRQRLLRAAPLRRAGAAPQRDLHGLSAARRDRGARHRERSRRDAGAGQSARREGSRGGGCDPGRGAVRAGDRGRAGDRWPRDPRDSASARTVSSSSSPGGTG